MLFFYPIGQKKSLFFGRKTTKIVHVLQKYFFIYLATLLKSFTIASKRIYAEKKYLMIFLRKSLWTFLQNIVRPYYVLIRSRFLAVSSYPASYIHVHDPFTFNYKDLESRFTLKICMYRCAVPCCSGLLWSVLPCFFSFYFILNVTALIWLANSIVMSTAYWSGTALMYIHIFKINLHSRCFPHSMKVFLRKIHEILQHKFPVIIL